MPACSLRRSRTPVVVRVGRACYMLNNVGILVVDLDEVLHVFLRSEIQSCLLPYTFDDILVTARRVPTARFVFTAPRCCRRSLRRCDPRQRGSSSTPLNSHLYDVSSPRVLMRGGPHRTIVPRPITTAIPWHAMLDRAFQSTIQGTTPWRGSCSTR